MRVKSSRCGLVQAFHIPSGIVAKYSKETVDVLDRVFLSHARKDPSIKISGDDALQAAIKVQPSCDCQPLAC